MKLNEPVKHSEPLVVRPGVAYTSAETARFMKVAPDTLPVWRATGRYPNLRYKKAGRRVLYMGEDILKFLDGEPIKAQPYVPKNRRPKPAGRRRKATGK